MPNDRPFVSNALGVDDWSDHEMLSSQSRDKAHSSCCSFLQNTANFLFVMNFLEQNDVPAVEQDRCEACFV